MFERVAFAGLESDQYTYLAVDHGDHIHIIVPRVELRTGKSLNIAPPGWKKIYDPIRDYFNEKYDWKSPDIEAHPENARMLAGLTAHNIPKSAKEAKEMIHEYALEAVKRGIITNREDMHQWLADIGEITREGKDYISVKPEGFTKAIRLKGVIYARDFDAHRFSEEIERKERERFGSNREDRERRVGELEQKIEAIVATRSEYNRKRYKREAQRNQERARGSNSTIERDLVFSKHQDSTTQLADRDPDRNRDLGSGSGKAIVHGRSRGQSGAVSETTRERKINDRIRENVAAREKEIRKLINTAGSYYKSSNQQNREYEQRTRRKSEEARRKLLEHHRKRLERDRKRWRAYLDTWFANFIAKIDRLGEQASWFEEQINWLGGNVDGLRDQIRGRFELVKIGVFERVKELGESLKNILQLNAGQEFGWRQKMR